MPTAVSRSLSSRLFAWISGLVLLAPLPAAAVPTNLELEVLASGLERPVAVTHAGDERLFVTLQIGEVVVFDGEKILPEPFLDLRNRVVCCGEKGLLSIAFHPDYDENDRFYAYYVRPGDDSILARFRVSADPDRADAASEEQLLRIVQPHFSHNGGQLHFGPDGYLYVASGDGGPGNDPDCQAQDPSSLLGKILRLDVDQNVGAPPFHGIPPSNPFAGPGDPLDEIWALGLRNPWRFSFDRLTGDLYIGDVGQVAKEELNFQSAASGGGENYGWKVMEGDLCLGDTSGCGFPVPGCNDPAYVEPFFTYGHDGSGCAVIGGYVYRGSAIPELQGYYLHGDFCSGIVWASIREGSEWRTERLSLQVPGLTSFGEDAAGEIYLTASGVLYRLVASGEPEASVIELASTALEVDESAGQVEIAVLRQGSTVGSASVDYDVTEGSATALDFTPVTGSLQWADGEGGPRSFTVPIIDDVEIEPDESFSVTLSSPVGAELGARATGEVTIADDDGLAEPCVAGPNTLCLLRGRFRAEVEWMTSEGTAGLGWVEPLGPDAGYFWFFDPDNPEIFVKVLDACVDPFQHFWVFAAGLTDVETRLTVTDTETGEVRRYDKPLNAGFDPIRDTTAFDTCP